MTVTGVTGLMISKESLQHDNIAACFDRFHHKTRKELYKMLYLLHSGKDPLDLDS